MRAPGLGLGKGNSTMEKTEYIRDKVFIRSRRWAAKKHMYLLTNFVNYGLILRIPFKLSSSAAHGSLHLPLCFSDFPEIFFSFLKSYDDCLP